MSNETDEHSDLSNNQPRGVDQHKDFSSCIGFETFGYIPRLDSQDSTSLYFVLTLMTSMLN